MSTFSGLGTAYSGLVAARAALEVTAQNVSNANTTGYTRQRVDQSANVLATSATYATNQSAGDGVSVTGVSRITNAIVNAQVNTTAATSAYWSTTSSAISSVETSLNEPSTDGLSSQLSTFWNAWQSYGNSVGSTTTSTTASAASVLIGAGQDVASTIATGYSAVQSAWSDERTSLATNVATINSTASQIAGLNQQITVLSASGGNTNALLDQRDAAVTTLAGLTGATTRSNSDGTIDVLVGGNALVSGTQARQLSLSSTPTDVSQVSSTTPVTISWSGTTTAVSVGGGTVAAQLTDLSAANGSGTGGVYAEAAKIYNDLASSVADQVNGLTAPSGSTTGAPFFTYTAGSAAATLAIVPTGASGIPADAMTADAVSQLGTASASPDDAWATYVSRVGSQSASASARSTSADTAATTATAAQTSTSGVDLDEETSNLVIYQHAYQASARVISTINDILDTLMQMGAS